MLSFDISDRVINIVKGDNSGQKIKIERSLSVEVPEDMIVNGEVVNIGGLAQLLLGQLKKETMMDKEAVVTFSSSTIVFKELVVPKAGSSEFLKMVQNQMSSEMGITDDFSISYSIVGDAGADSAGSVKVLATACPSVIVAGFRKLFQEMQLKLSSVNISCNSIARIVLSEKTNLEKMPMLVCQIDDNYLGLTLFENGQMAFARYEPISAEDYETEEYLTEAISENIFRMEQFNKARGGPGLNNVVLYGKIEDYMKLVDALDSLDVKATALGVPSQITGYENFEFTVFANAIGALYKRNKATERINLLEVDSASGKVTEDASGVLATLGIAVGVSVALIAVITGVIKLRENSVRKDIEETDAQIAECDKIIAENQKLHDYLIVLNQYQLELDNCKNNLETLPAMTKDVIDQFESLLTYDGEEITYGGFTYDLDDGCITFSDIVLAERQTANDFVKTIIDTDYFADVMYSGYTGTGEGEDRVVIDDLILYFKDVPLETEDETADSAAETDTTSTAEEAAE